MKDKLPSIGVLAFVALKGNLQQPQSHRRAKGDNAEYQDPLPERRESGRFDVWERRTWGARF